MNLVHFADDTIILLTEIQSMLEILEKIVLNVHKTELSLWGREQFRKLFIEKSNTRKGMPGFWSFSGKIQ